MHRTGHVAAQAANPLEGIHTELAGELRVELARQIELIIGAQRAGEPRCRRSLAISPVVGGRRGTDVEEVELVFHGGSLLLVKTSTDVAMDLAELLRCDAERVARHASHSALMRSHAGGDDARNQGL